MLEPAAGRGHLSLELRRAGLEVASFDLHRYANPLVPDIEAGDIRRLTTLEPAMSLFVDPYREDGGIRNRAFSCRDHLSPRRKEEIQQRERAFGFSVF